MLSVRGGSSGLSGTEGGAIFSSPCSLDYLLRFRHGPFHNCALPAISQEFTSFWNANHFRRSARPLYEVRPGKTSGGAPKRRGSKTSGIGRPDALY